MTIPAHTPEMLAMIRRWAEHVNPRATDSYATMEAITGDMQADPSFRTWGPRVGRDGMRRRHFAE